LPISDWVRFAHWGLVALVAACCGSPITTTLPTPLQDFGPLAVAVDDGFSGEALKHGSIRIVEDCAVLRSGFSDLILVWPHGSVSWDGFSSAIRYHNSDGSRVDMHDGTQVTLEGDGSSSNGGPSNEQWVQNINWVDPPNLNCPLNERFSINAVRLGSP
jgi:hypothetical protein